MKTKRTRILTAWLLALFFVFGAFAFSACLGSDDDNLAIPSYLSVRGGEALNGLTISIMDIGYGDGSLDDDGNITFPPRIHPHMPPHVNIKSEYLLLDGAVYTITIIGSFAGLTNLKSMVIPASITEINPYAFFNCINLERVSFGENSGLQFIGDEAFKNCIKLSAIEIPAGAVVGIRAFQGWTSSQTIRVHFANQAAADAAWGTGWRQNTNANIVYLPE